MPAPRKYPPELRERAVRLVCEAREQDPELSLNAAVQRIGPRVGVNNDTLRGWVETSRYRQRPPIGDYDERHGGAAGVASRGDGTETRERDVLGGIEFLCAGSSTATAVVTRLNDEHRDRETAGLRWGVEPIGAEPTKHGCGIAPSTYCAAKTRPLSARWVRDAVVLEHVRLVHASPKIGRRLCGVRKVRHAGDPYRGVQTTPEATRPLDLPQAESPGAPGVGLGGGGVGDHPME